MSKDYTHLIIHCSATYEGVDIRPETIKKWHMGKTGRGWSRVGYSDIITIDGDLHNMHFADGTNPYDDKIEHAEMTWGVRGMNQYAKHVCYIGGMQKNPKKPKNTLTKEQKETLTIYIKHEILRHKNILIAGHNQFSNKACPSFDVPNFCCEIGLPMKNVYYK
tara:strand:- start:7675 stop:8163 length:489 start_codon:yes stop_codon:yes gene_type:complete